MIVDHTDSAVADGRAAFLPLAARISGALDGFSDEDLDAALRVIVAATVALGGEGPSAPAEGPATTLPAPAAHGGSRP